MRMCRASTAAKVFTSLGCSTSLITTLPSVTTLNQSSASAVSETRKVAAGFALSAGAEAASCGGTAADTSVWGAVSGLFATAGVTLAGAAGLGTAAGAFWAAVIGGLTAAGRRL